MIAHPSRYSLLAVVGAGFFVSAPIATWLAVDAITAPVPAPASLALDVPVTAAVAPPAPPEDVPEELAPIEGTITLNLHELAQHGRIVPAFENGRAIGFKLFGIRPGSSFEQAGLQNGDIVTRVNGIEVTSPERALEAYERAHDGLVVVDIIRRGHRGTLTHHIRVHTAPLQQQP